MITKGIVEVKVIRSYDHARDHVSGLGLNLDKYEEIEQIKHLEDLFRSVLITLYKDKYTLEITERE